MHKWSRESRPYRASELNLPDEVFVSGTLPSDVQPIISIGGTRSPTVETFCLVTNICRLIAERGCTIVSGGVPGVDLAAHLGALDAASGRTHVVLANPVELELGGHEWSNKLICDGIKSSGSFISEYTIEAQFGSAEHRERLLQRDRIIRGMCDVFVAFECNADSATIDTALRALAQGKKVISVKQGRPSIRRGLELLGSDERVKVLTDTDATDEQIADVIVHCAHSTSEYQQL